MHTNSTRSSPPDPFAPLFERAGYTLSLDAKGRYYEGMVRLMGGDLKLLRCLRDEHLIRLFSNAQVRKGRAFTYRELLGIAQPGAPDSVNRFASQMSALVERQVWLRGYNLQCPVCDLHAWYDLAMIAEGVCQGCRSPLALPLELQFAFRLNRLWMEGMSQGALTVLLALLLLMDSSNHELLWRAGCQVTRGGVKTDLDLVALDREALMLVECKDNFQVKDARPLIAQLERAVSVARDLDARFLFATLRETIPDAIGDFLRTNSTQAVFRRDLLRRD